ncbi:thiamine pyrophosphate-binding protein, partial [Candidatus Bathyarchaeota archaeon]|nr:thiamine pyrophosphate-binding protein [Candidatus Bathyarchaeota archaeon]
TVSDVLVAQMSEWGIQYVFGIPGTSTLGITDALRRNPKITYIQVRHEQTAALMASAYGKLTGHVAVCLGVSGPGATYLTTGLYDASLVHAPVLALTGMVSRQLIGPGSIQEIDQYSLFEPMCVFNKILMSEDQTTILTTLAIKHALLDRGVAHIGIPKDVQKLPCKEEIISFEGRVPNMAFSQCGDLVKEAAKIIDYADAPVIVAGFGAIDQGDKLLELARKISAPIVTTFRAKGIVNEDNDLYAGSHGTIASTAAAQLVRKSDLLIVIGSSFSDMTQLPNKKTIQVDINPMMIARRFPVEVGLVGNSSEIIPALVDAVEERTKNNYLAEIGILKKKWIDQLEKETDALIQPIRPQYIIKLLNENIAHDAVISLDTGENCWWFGRNFMMKKTQKLVLSGYLATMGFGLPGAIAASMAYPSRQTICITGDGGFTMVMGDLLTVVKYKLPLKIFLFNNKQLGMIMQEQKIENYPNWQTELYNCDFAAYAQNCGAIGLKVTDPKELEGTIKEALAEDQPVLVDIATDPKRFR